MFPRSCGCWTRTRSRAGSVCPKFELQLQRSGGLRHQFFRHSVRPRLGLVYEPIVPSPGPAKGSGIHVASSRNVTVSLSDLSRNEGAAVFVDRPSENVTVSDSALVNNTIAIQVSSLSGLTMTRDRFERNSAAVIVTDSTTVAAEQTNTTRSAW